MIQQVNFENLIALIKKFKEFFYLSDLLPDATIAEIFGAGWRVGWVLRSQVHVKCRGVLASKGYIILLERE
jgi:hypothetical protein